MKTKTVFLLLLTVVISTSCSTETENAEDRNIAGLYYYWAKGEGETYLYLYPDKTGVRYYEKNADNVTWTTNESASADLYLNEIAENYIKINNTHEFKKKYDYKPSSIDIKVIGEWELENIKTISPVKYDPLLDKIEYEEDAEVVERDINSTEDYLKYAGYYSKDMKNIIFTNEHVSVNTYRSGYVLMPYNTKNDKITDLDGYVRYSSYNVKDNKLSLSFVGGIDNEPWILFILRYKKNKSVE